MRDFWVKVKCLQKTPVSALLHTLIISLSRASFSRGTIFSGIMWGHWRVWGWDDDVAENDSALSFVYTSINCKVSFVWVALAKANFQLPALPRGSMRRWYLTQSNPVKINEDKDASFNDTSCSCDWKRLSRRYFKSLLSFWIQQNCGEDCDQSKSIEAM